MALAVTQRSCPSHFLVDKIVTGESSTMSEPKKRLNGWAFWGATALFSLPILYVLSIGPACWLTLAGVLPYRATQTVYHPILVSRDYCPKWIWDAAAWYSGDSGIPRPVAILGAAPPETMLEKLWSESAPLPL